MNATAIDSSLQTGTIFSYCGTTVTMLNVTIRKDGVQNFTKRNHYRPILKAYRWS